MSLLPTAEILSEFKKGNPQAMHDIHQLFYPSLRSFAGNLMGEIPDADDILTEVFITLWRKHESFESLHNVKAFLYISTKNACINQIKKHQRDLALKEALTLYLSGECEEFVLNEMIRTEVLVQVYHEIETLPLQCRRVLKECYVEGLSNAEIAEKFNISVNTVKNHKVRALNMLRFKFTHENAM